MPEYKFHDEQVSATLEDLQSQVTRYDAELENFEAAKNTLKAHWEGDEADIYEALFTRFQSGSTAVRNVVAEVYNSLSESGDLNNSMRSDMRTELGH
ncbi:hypothetical protein GOEFS_039_00030 [Gordonia effusa NBRC 100432]|uniref:ESAT-6-like protein n=1 Tax=Gordonia effusa NBRC 100432 TaxID=1077974 RepID=H0QY68_9ACTN|nr:hypothetical protein [Gordonia effusa]GAB17769.1 hypothetical protein GOEFS_039_00030 [Gordonia effusa NBRC 100432]